MLFVPLGKHSFCRVFDVLLIETFQKSLSCTDSTRRLDVFHVDIGYKTAAHFKGRF